MAFIKVITGDDQIIINKENFAGVLASTANGNQFIMFFFKNGEVYKRDCPNHGSTHFIGNLKNDANIEEIIAQTKKIIMLENNGGFFIRDHIIKNLQFFRVQDNSQYFIIGFHDGKQYEIHSASQSAIDDLNKFFHEINA